MPNPRGVPVVNYLIIGVNIAVYLLVTLPMSMTPPDLNDPALLEYLKAIPMYRDIPISLLINKISAYDLFIFAHGFKPAHPSLSDLFASMFLHAGFMHIFGNMLFLWIYGDNVEHRLGSFKYLIVYLVTGVAATLFFTLFSLHSMIPMVGASGAISGVLGLYFLWFPRNKVRVFLMLFPFFMEVVLLPARLVLGFYLVLDNILPFLLTSGSGGGVAYGAHIGGFLAGLGIAYGTDRMPGLAAMLQSRKSWRPEPDLFSEPEPNQERSLSQKIHDYVQREDYTQAVRNYFTARHKSDRQTISPADRLQIGYHLLKENHYHEALAVLRQYIADQPHGPFLDRAHLGAGITLFQGLGQLTSSYQYFLSVLDLDPDPETEAQARRYLQSIQSMQKMQIRKK